MTTRYLDLHDIAQLAGVTDGSMRQYHKNAVMNRRAGDPRPGDLPEPDAVIGTRPRTAHPGWTLDTIRAWLDGRPRAKPQSGGFVPGAAYHTGNGLWLVIVRVEAGVVYMVEKFDWDEKQTMRSYRKSPIFKDVEDYITLGERGRAEENGQGWDVRADDFGPCPDGLELDETDLHTPETEYRRG